jgi:hypothetical protein
LSGCADTKLTGVSNANQLHLGSMGTKGGQQEMFGKRKNALELDPPPLKPQ